MRGKNKEEKILATHDKGGQIGNYSASISLVCVIGGYPTVESGNKRKGYAAISQRANEKEKEKGRYGQQETLWSPSLFRKKYKDGRKILVPQNFES